MNQAEGMIIGQRKLGRGIFDLHISCYPIAAEAKPGQFVMVYPKDQSRLLPRPISICDADADSGFLRLVYRVAGGGTQEFSEMEAGGSVRLMGPLGNGFPLQDKRALYIGGGIGIPPLLFLAKTHGNGTAVLGYRDDQLFLLEEFAQLCETRAATEDGSFGVRGNVMQILSDFGMQPELIYACGPLPMLRALKGYAAERAIPCYLSLEERMACGVGACLGCVTRTEKKDDHSMVNNTRVCKEGPVFLSTEVTL